MTRSTQAVVDDVTDVPVMWFERTISDVKVGFLISSCATHGSTIYALLSRTLDDFRTNQIAVSQLKISFGSINLNFLSLFERTSLRELTGPRID